MILCVYVCVCVCVFVCVFVCVCVGMYDVCVVCGGIGVDVGVLASSMCVHKLSELN